MICIRCSTEGPHHYIQCLILEACYFMQIRVSHQALQSYIFLILLNNKVELIVFWDLSPFMLTGCIQSFLLPIVPKLCFLELMAIGQVGKRTFTTFPQIFTCLICRQHEVPCSSQQIIQDLSITSKKF